MMNISSERFNYIDWAKTIGITIVVFCHIPQYYTITRSFFQLLQMPLFFFLSGYLHKVSNQTINEVFKNLSNKLIVPYILYQFLFYPYWLIQHIIENSDFNFKTIIITPIINILIGNPINGVTWFILALLIIKISAFYILKFSHSLNKCTIICIIIIITRFLMYSQNDSIKVSFLIDSTLYYFPYFFIGYYFKKYNIINNVIIFKKHLHPFLIIAFLITLWGASPMGIEAFESTIIKYFLRLFIGFSGTLFIIYICILLNNINSKYIKTLSTGTIAILGLHWMFIGTINFVIKIVTNSLTEDIKYTTIIAVVIALLIVIICYFIIVFFQKKSPILLGNRK